MHASTGFTPNFLHTGREIEFPFGFLFTDAEDLVEVVADETLITDKNAIRAHVRHKRKMTPRIFARKTAPKTPVRPSEQEVLPESYEKGGSCFGSS